MLPHQLQNKTRDRLSVESEAFSINSRISRDIDEQANSLDGWNQTYEQLSAGAFLGCTVDLCFNGIQLFRETTHQHLYQTGSPRPGCDVLAVPIAMEGRAVFSGQTVDCNHCMILRADDSLDFCSPRYCDLVTIVLPPELLQKYVIQVADLDLLRVLQGSGVRSPNPFVISAWRTFLLNVLDSICTAPHQLQHTNLRHALAQDLLWNLITVLESLQSAPRPLVLTPSRRQVVERAKAYFEEHIEEPVTVTDLCVALNVSRRTLQYSFQDVLDINPVRYLKVIRLNHARRDLRANCSAEITVGDIAAKWGFWHLGRFSSEYRQMFGELPSVTLKNSALRY